MKRWEFKGYDFDGKLVAHKFYEDENRDGAVQKALKDKTLKEFDEWVMLEQDRNTMHAKEKQDRSTKFNKKYFTEKSTIVAYDKLKGDKEFGRVGITIDSETHRYYVLMECKSNATLNHIKFALDKKYNVRIGDKTIEHQVGDQGYNTIGEYINIKQKALFSGLLDELD